MDIFIHRLHICRQDQQYNTIVLSIKHGQILDIWFNMKSVLQKQVHLLLWNLSANSSFCFCKNGSYGAHENVVTAFCRQVGWRYYQSGHYNKDYNGASTRLYKVIQKFVTLAVVKR